MKVKKVEIVEEPPKKFRWDFIISEKADPNLLESGSCIGTDIDSVYSRLRKSFSEYDIVDLTKGEPYKEEDSNETTIYIDENVGAPQKEQAPQQEEPPKAEESVTEPREDSGLIVLPLEYFQPIELEA